MFSEIAYVRHTSTHVDNIVDLRSIDLRASHVKTSSHTGFRSIGRPAGRVCHPPCLHALHGHTRVKSRAVCATSARRNHCHDLLRIVVSRRMPLTPAPYPPRTQGTATGVSQAETEKSSQIRSNSKRRELAAPGGITYSISKRPDFQGTSPSRSACTAQCVGVILRSGRAPARG